jgi:hypothetical protein
MAPTPTDQPANCSEMVLVGRGTQFEGDASWLTGNISYIKHYGDRPKKYAGRTMSRREAV